MTKHTLKQWIIATRPWSFPASTMPVIVTISYIFASRFGDFSQVNWWLALACFFGVLLFHAGGNLVSDFFDYKTGVDRKDNTGQRMLVDGVFDAKTILRYGITLLAIGSLFGLFIVWQSTINVLFVGLIGLVLTLCYPKLKYRALGDLDIFITFGVLVSIGTSFSLLNALDYRALLTAIPVGFLIVGILHANNTRDSEFDSRANVRTMAMNMGLNASKFYYIALVVCAYLMEIILLVIGINSWTTLLFLFSLPVAIRNIRTMQKCQQSSDIAMLDGMSAQLVMIFSILLSIGNLLAPLTR